MSLHLDEHALEALSTGRDDLVSAEMHAHVDECAECAARISQEQLGVEDASLGLKRMMPELDLDALVANAMTKAMTRPWVPPSHAPMAMMTAAISARRNAVFTPLV